MSEKTEPKETLTLTRKILKWFFLTLFIFSFGITLLLYNFYTVISEKNIKKIGKEIVSDFLYKNKPTIDEVYDDLILYAKEHPEENIEFPTGIKEFAINIKGEELSSIEKEEFYEKMPVIIADNIYRSLLDQFINNNIRGNEAIPKAIRTVFTKVNRDNRLVIQNLLILSTILTFVSLIVFILLLKIPKALLDIGIGIIIISLPVYLFIYFTLPLTNSVIRKTDFITIASMVTSMLESVQKNYLYTTLFGAFVFFVSLLYLLGFRFKIKFKRKSEFERIIKS